MQHHHRQTFIWNRIMASFLTSDDVALFANLHDYPVQRNMSGPTSFCSGVMRESVWVWPYVRRIMDLSRALGTAESTVWYDRLETYQNCAGHLSVRLLQAHVGPDSTHPLRRMTTKIVARKPSMSTLADSLDQSLEKMNSFNQEHYVSALACAIAVVLLRIFVKWRNGPVSTVLISMLMCLVSSFFQI